MYFKMYCVKSKFIISILVSGYIMLHHLTEVLRGVDDSELCMNYDIET